MRRPKKDARRRLTKMGAAAAVARVGQQPRLAVHSGFSGAWLTPDVAAIGLQDAGAHIVAQRDLQDGPAEIGCDLGIQHGEKHLDAPVQVAAIISSSQTNRCCSGAGGELASLKSGISRGRDVGTSMRANRSSPLGQRTSTARLRLRMCGKGQLGSKANGVTTGRISSRKYRCNRSCSSGSNRKGPGLTNGQMTPIGRIHLIGLAALV